MFVLQALDTINFDWASMSYERLFIRRLQTHAFNALKLHITVYHCLCSDIQAAWQTP